MYFASGKQSISKKEKNGEVLVLRDNSVWLVGPFDKSKTMMWSTMDEVSIASHFGDKFKITNIKRNETIEAEFIVKL